MTFTSDWVLTFKSLAESVCTGASNCEPRGYDWEQVAGQLKQISAGYSGVWGVNDKDNIYYRNGTFGDTGDIGNDWIQVPSF